MEAVSEELTKRVPRSSSPVNFSVFSEASLACARTGAAAAEAEAAR
jgi:hypothetical protein